MRTALPASVALLAALVGSGMTPSRAGSARSSRAVDHSTTLSVSISTPVKVHGLLAEQVFVLSNPGTTDARKAQAHIRFAPSITVQRFSSPQGKCTVAAPVTVDCRLGTVRAGVAIRFKARYRLTYVPPKANNAMRAAAANAPAVATSGPSYFMDRYWLCGCSTVYTYPNGWTVPASDQDVTVGPDDTVHLSGGYYISPDGVLHFPDGRMIKDTLTQELFIPRKA